MIAAVCGGTRRLFGWLDHNPAVRLAPARYSHGVGVVSRSHRFVAINSAISVALDGSVNAETVGGRLLSGPGGQPDYAEAAMSARDGIGIVAMPSTAARGTASRIVRRLGPEDAVTVPRTLADRVVTEYGVAELRGRSLEERASALRAVAHPDFRSSRCERRGGWRPRPGTLRAPAVVSEDEMPNRRRFAVVATPLLALLVVAAAILLPSGAAPAAAQSTEPAVTCFEISVGWRICAAPAVAPAQPPGPCATGVAVPDAANNPGLVADCTALLAVKDALRGAGAPDWSAAIMITTWDGVTVSGDAAASDGVAPGGARADGHNPGRAGRPQ